MTPNLPPQLRLPQLMVLVAFAKYRAKIVLFVVCLSASQTRFSDISEGLPCLVSISQFSHNVYPPPPHHLFLTTYTLKVVDLREPRSAKGKRSGFVQWSFRVQIQRPTVITNAFILFLSPGMMAGYLESGDCTDWRSGFQSRVGQEIFVLSKSCRPALRAHPAFVMTSSPPLSTEVKRVCASYIVHSLLITV